MASGRLPVLRAVRVAYEDVARVLMTMPTLVVIALAIDLVADLMRLLGPPGGMPMLAFGVVIGLGTTWLLTPFVIAVHRLILVDEVADRYRLDPQDQRFSRFFTWSLVLWVMLALPSIIIRVLMMPMPVISPSAVGSALAVLTIVAAVLSLRLMVLFPAIAVDAPGATPANAAADMHGCVLDVFLICSLAVLPVMAIDYLLAGVRAQTLAALIVEPLANLLVRVLLIVIASRAFQALGDRVLRPGVA